MRWPDVAAAERDVAAALGMPVRLRAATAPALLSALSPREQAKAPNGLRLHDWLLGRAALALMLGPVPPAVKGRSGPSGPTERGRLGGAESSEVKFPHRALSLTHAAGMAVAAGCDGSQGGLGVDFEGWRLPDPRTARFFLSGREQGAVRHGGDLLRLWTVKEALFKATAANAGAAFVDYETASPRAAIGTAVDGRGRVFRYVSGRLPQGWLTVAVSDAAV